MTKLSFDCCVEQWEQSKELRSLAMAKKPVVIDSNGKTQVFPTLANIKANVTFLKPMTRAMAQQGCIVTNKISLLRDATRSFYTQMGLDLSNTQVKCAVYVSSYVAKKMLCAIRKKWYRWELPRVAFQQCNDFLFEFNEGLKITFPTYWLQKLQLT